MRAEAKKMSGFTIIELLLATTIFSLVMLGALTGFLQAGGLFYKGVSVTQTQGVTKQIIDDVSANISATSNVQSPNAGGYKYYCIGGTRYTYILNHQVVLPDTNFTSGSGNYGLLRDSLPGSNSCAQPCVSGSCPSGAIAFNNPLEMLGDQMRLADFSITAGSGSLYTINVVVAYGDSSSLNLSNPQQPTCVGNTHNQQFCAVSSLSTSVIAGLSI